jgi:hypothetical protein
MASNLSTIGFAFANEDEFRKSMIECAASASANLDCADGTYGIWRSRSGAEIWFHLGKAADGEVEIFGLTPFFGGASDVTVQITRPIKRVSDNVFEGAFHAWVTTADGAEQLYPLVFDAIDFAAHKNAAWPALARARLCGFARELAAFPDEVSYYAARIGGDSPQLSSKAFIPIGLFASEQPGDAGTGSEAQAPASTALLTGRVAEYRRLTNEATNSPFEWMLVETLEAMIDIVADPATVSGVIAEGGTIETTVLLFGRLAD